MKSAPEPDAPLVVRTPGWVVAIRLVLVPPLWAAPFIAGENLDLVGTGAMWGLFACGFWLACYRIRDRMTLEDDGVTAEWSPLSLGPIPLVRRRAFVPWGRVIAVFEQPVQVGTYFVLASFPAWGIVLDVDGKRVRFRIMPGTEHKHAALARIVRRANPAAIGLGVRDFVRRWEKEQGIAPPIRLAKGVDGRVRRVR